MDALNKTCIIAFHTLSHKGMRAVSTHIGQSGWKESVSRSPIISFSALNYIASAAQFPACHLGPLKGNVRCMN